MLILFACIIYSILYSPLAVNTHSHKKLDKKPDSPSSGCHRTSRQSSIPSSIPSPKQGSLSSGHNDTHLFVDVIVSVMF